MGAKVIQVVETDLERRGSGRDESSPIRVVRQYYSFDGELLAELDPYRERYLEKRPMAWRVANCIGGWVLFDKEEDATAFATTTNKQVQGLYVRDGN